MAGLRLVGLFVAAVLLAFGALKLWIEGNEDLCSGKDTWRCDDAVVQAAGVALWVFLAALLALTILALFRLRRWIRQQRRLR